MDFFIVVLITLLLTNPTLSQKSGLYPSKYLKDHLIIRLYWVSFIVCKRECLGRSQCHSVNFCQKTSICELNLEPAQFQISQLDKRSRWVYSAKTTWSQFTFTGCKCSEGEKCEVTGDQDWFCKVAECRSAKTINEYDYHGNIQTIGGRVTMVCSNMFWIPEDVRSHGTLICGSTGKWEISKPFPKCGRMLFRAFAGLSRGSYRRWLGLQQTTDILCNYYLYPENCTLHYRHNDADKWESLSVSRVLLSVTKDDAQVHYVLFNGTGSNLKNWFVKERLLTSSWSDLTQSNVNSLEMAGEVGDITSKANTKCYQRRRFMIGKTSGDCETDSGWFVATKRKPDQTMCCRYEDTETLTLWYSKGKTVGVWNKDSDVDKADFFDFVIFTED